ncbi:hypothetical protein ISF_00426 [Cordyceps fumosorosea ARSEF 2679]|uniref:Major facilitator superfamily transporter n=1 Tax=Cordyceps fumosorosea (strain ARSEF 2679) TaxID=1081104 RepID=A0A168E960_CORFA|nr:hypothetical protein ISF_00426 [Cordyceps fumosorosea ARSEF 2679]OAA73525.1 hypothetical protein ISF_00426 [Cordyceps fumosorosea ARSEF 2679]
MGLLSDALRPRQQQQQLPVYQRPGSPSKERYSDDDYYYSDEDDSSSSSRPSNSGYSSRSVSDTIGSSSNSGGALLLPKRPKARSSNSLGFFSRYRFRLPTKLTRYVLLVVLGTTLLFIFSLVRASQVENWKVVNGKVPTRPAPPPVWEKFPFLERYYGGIRTLVPLNESEPEYPRENEPIPMERPSSAEDEDPENETRSETNPKGKETIEKKAVPPSMVWSDYRNRSVEADIQECFIDPANQIRVPELRYYTGRPHGFPMHIGGSYEMLNLPEDMCFERYGRYGPYGFGYSTRTGGLGTGEHSENEGAELVWDSRLQVDFRDVDWAETQRRCLRSNAHRFKALPTRKIGSQGFVNAVLESDKNQKRGEDETVTPPLSTETKATDDDDSIAKKGRTAIVFRCWDEFFFREDDIANLRSMIMELSLGSGGRYDVHLLVQVKNDGAHPVWADQEAYEQRIRETIPKEFQGLVTLWTETQMLSIYQGIHDKWTVGPDHSVHGSYRGLVMAMQYFAYQHPEYDHFWHWEMDVRYTGHYYDLLTKIESWAQEQPRKGLWERNARFYIPATHGSWDDFKHLARVQTETGTVSADNVWGNLPTLNEGESQQRTRKGDRSVWGPIRPADENDWFEHEDDPVPPTTYESDKYQWGVGEEADYITLNPVFNPEGTTWGLRDDITGFNESHPPPPRRASIITTSRMSRRLLLSMHRATTFKKQFAFAEMWPATVALHHGYKAVFVPHPLFVDRKWPVEYLASTLNAGRNGAAGGARASVYGAREHNLRGLSWFYNTGFAPNLYRRWLGLRVNNDGGEDFEKTEDSSRQGDGVGAMPGGEGRMCLPPMLLHPIKEVELAVEAPPEEAEEAVESDPTA